MKLVMHLHIFTLDCPPYKATIIPNDDFLGSVIPAYTRVLDMVDFNKYEMIEDNYDIDLFLLYEDIELEVDTFTYALVTLYSGVIAELLYSGNITRMVFQVIIVISLKDYLNMA
jgi:hypothetical protein